MTDEKDPKTAATEPQEAKTEEKEVKAEQEVKEEEKKTTDNSKQTTEKKESDAPKEIENQESKIENSPEEKENSTPQKDETKEDKIPDLKPGMTVRVYQKIKELNAKGEEKERIQYFEGLIIAMKHGKENGATITVRKVSGGIGVEKIFPLNLPTIDKIEIKKQSRVRRAKLYFLKNLKRPYKKKLKEIKTK